MQTDNEMRYLIWLKRKWNNNYYWIGEASRIKFWSDLIYDLNHHYRFNYTSKQCKNKFNWLKRDYYVSNKIKINYILLYIY